MPAGLIGFPATKYIIKVDNRITRQRCITDSQLTIKTPERRQWRRANVFFVNFEHALHLFLVYCCLLD